MFFITVFCVSWLVFALLIKKEKLIYVYPTALLAMLMSLSSDSLLRFLPLWDYHDVDTNLPKELLVFMDDFGLYPVIGSLFAQYMPATWKKWLLYMLAWTSGGIFVEWLLIYKKYMSYHGFWSLWYSYAADWLIFGILSLQYKLHLKLLRTPRLDVDAEGKTVSLSLTQRVHPLKQSAVLPNLSARGLTGYLGARSLEAETFCFALEPGAATDMKTHRGYEAHYVVEGTLSVRKGQELLAIKQGELCSFPSGIPHAFQNAGKTRCTVVAIIIKDGHFVPGALETAELS